MGKDHPEKHCFIVGAIGEDDSPERIHADWLYDGIILPVFESLPDWIVERADKIPTPGMVSSQIINRLHDAELVIADLSFHNANAFYEMAIRHKIGKPIIHMIRKGERIPFDVTLHRAIQFAHKHPNDHKEARAKLVLAVAEATKPGFEADNPITHARGKLEFEEKATPAMKVLAEDLAVVRARLEAIESAVQTGQQNAVGQTLLGAIATGLWNPKPGLAVSTASTEARRVAELLTRPSFLNEGVADQPPAASQQAPFSSFTKSE